MARPRSVKRTKIRWLQCPRFLEMDSRKAFDFVWHEGLFYKLLKVNIGGNFYNLIKSLYCNSSCSIRVRENETRSFSYSQGVRQGCILSPLLFNLYINNCLPICSKTLSLIHLYSQMERK